MNLYSHDHEKCGEEMIEIAVFFCSFGSVKCLTIQERENRC